VYEFLLTIEFNLDLFYNFVFDSIIKITE